MDENAHGLVEGPHFEFEPYDYGPFDKEVYTVLEDLENKKLVAISPPNFNQPRMYRLTDKGLLLGRDSFTTFSKDTQNYISELVEWIKSRSFTQIVAAIYKYYPKMKTNSVFGN